MHNDSAIKSTLYKLAKFIPDKLYLTLKFRKNFGYFPNWDNPKTFSEKINWLKLYNRNPQYTVMVDKYAAKEYVRNIIGDKYIIPTLGVWERGEDIDFDSLPNQFVLKATHDSGRIIICRDKSKLDKKKAIREMNESLKRDFYYVTREWPYKNVPRKIIAEEYIEERSGELRDFKFFCYNGEPKFFKIDFGRFIEHHANYYDVDGTLLPFCEQDFPCDPSYQPNIPQNINEMGKIACELSKGIPFIRVDLYNCNGKVYFGELTFYPASGMGEFNPSEYNKILGDMLTLPNA